MVHIFRYLFLGTALLFATGCFPPITPRLSLAEPAGEEQSLAARIDELLAAPELANATVGLLVTSLKTGDTLYAKNAGKLFMPASNLKLITTATALRLLGADYRFPTEIYLCGQLQDSTFVGDVVLKGYGDPTLLWDDSLALVPQFWQFAATLYAAGFRNITGRFIGDDNWLDDDKYGLGWSWENEALSFQAPVGALSLNRNCFDLQVTAGDSVGAPAVVTTKPPFDGVTISNRVITAKPPMQPEIDVRYNGADNFVITGAITPVAAVIKSRAVDNPTTFALALLVDACRAAGLRCEVAQVDIDDLIEVIDLSGTPPFAGFTSPPLAEIVYGINKESRNLAAELLLKNMGRVKGGEGSFAEGAAIISEYWSGLGLAFGPIRMVDGSGLSRKNLVTPGGLVQLLTVMRADSVFYHSLPIAGVDGTMRSAGWSINPMVRAKTGSLENVQALSGYARTTHHDELVFSFIINHFLVETEKIIYIQNRFCHLLSSD